MSQSLPSKLTLRSASNLKVSKDAPSFRTRSATALANDTPSLNTRSRTAQKLKASTATLASKSANGTTIKVHRKPQTQNRQIGTPLNSSSAQNNQSHSSESFVMQQFNPLQMSTSQTGVNSSLQSIKQVEKLHSDHVSSHNTQKLINQFIFQSDPQSPIRVTQASVTAASQPPPNFFPERSPSHVKQVSDSNVLSPHPSQTLIRFGTQQNRSSAIASTIPSSNMEQSQNTPESTSSDNSNSLPHNHKERSPVMPST